MKAMKSMLCVAAGVLLSGYAGFAADTSASHYRIVDRIPVGGEGGWDLLALDEGSGKLFVSHSTQVEVIDTGAKKRIGAISDTKGVHGIAIAPELKKGFITCGKENKVAVFDIDTLAVTTRVETGKNPDAIAYEPSTRRIFAFNGGSANATVIDAKTDAVVGTIALDGKPELPAVDGKGTLFVNLEDKSMVVAIDAKAMKVKARWPIAPGEEPTGLALDAVNHRLFIGCANKLMVMMDSESGKVVGSQPIGERVDGVCFDSELKRAYSSNGDGTVTVVEELTPDTFKVVENVATQKGAKTMTLDTKTHHLFVPAAEYAAAPAPTAEVPKPRPAVIPGSFVVLNIAPVK